MHCLLPNDSDIRNVQLATHNYEIESSNLGFLDPWSVQYTIIVWQILNSVLIAMIHIEISGMHVPWANIYIYMVLTNFVIKNIHAL